MPLCHGSVYVAGWHVSSTEFEVRRAAGVQERLNYRAQGKCGVRTASKASETAIGIAAVAAIGG